MQIALSSPLARNGPPPSASDAAAAEGSGSEFANLLQQQAPARREPEARTDAADERRETRQRAAARTPARGAERPADDSEAGATEGERSTPPGGTETSNSTDPGLRDWLAGLHLPAHLPDAPAGDAAVAAGADDAFQAQLGDEASAATPAWPGHDAATSPAADAARTGARDKAAGPRTAAIQADAAAAEPADGARAVEAHEPARVAFDLPAAPRATATTDAAPLTSAPAAPASATAQAAAPAAVALATPLDDPQFPRAFGVQISVLARGGVQQAELHLNPAEMGPVSVQIVMEGTQARIDFGAAAAGTRQMIEHSLPELASALREAGLTLTGGGVSQHAGGHDDGRGQAGAPRDGEAPAQPAAAETAPLQRSVRAGGLDLYA